MNHRPAFGLQSEKLQQAFETLGFSTENGPAIDRGDMLDILQSKGILKISLFLIFTFNKIALFSSFFVTVLMMYLYGTEHSNPVLFSE